MKVAVLGFGTVGVGVYEMLANAQGLEQGPVLVRPGKDDAPFKVTDIEAIVNDPEVWAVAEVMGGIEPAFTYAAKALKAGKHFVTSNKALVAAKGVELQKIADESGAAFLFSAACGGAVPFLHNLSVAVKSDKILSLGGILNGTTNYMLDCMQRFGMDYGEALADAQKLGYAEADPTADVTGQDALRKIMLACAVSYGKLPSEGLLNEGIDSLTAADVEHFSKKGYTCRLIVSGGPAEESVYAYVEPVLLRDNAPECSVLLNYNMAKYEGRNSGPIVLMGQGAGRYPTASAVLRDLSCIAMGMKAMFPAGVHEVKADNSGAKHLYYVRLPEEMAGMIDSESMECENGIARLITKEMSVSDMHAAAKQIREKGGKLFFAAIGG